MTRRATAATVVAALAAANARSRGRTRRVQRAIAQMDPERQAAELSWLVASREFGWLNEMALSFALFRTYAVPSISVLLQATGEFTSRARKRYDDTELVLAEIAKHGHDRPGRGRDALRRMNAMHAAYDIDPDDTLYTLTTFVCEPVRWIRRWGWRELTEHEIAASTTTYARLGERMGLKDLPRDYAWYDAWNREYEATRFAPHPANRAVADASVALFLDIYLPGPLHGVGEVVIRSLMDPPLLAALGYDPAPAAVTTAADAALRARGLVQRHLLPERRRPYDLTQRRRPTYPHGHQVLELGTFPSAEDRARANAAVAAHRRSRGAHTAT